MEYAINVKLKLDESDLRRQVEQINKLFEEKAKEVEKIRVRQEQVAEPAAERARGIRGFVERIQERIFGRQTERVGADAAGAGRGVGFGRMVGLLLGVFAIIEILKSIFDAVMKLAMQGAKLSGYMQASLKLLDLAFSLVLKPLADLVGMVLLRVLVPFIRWVTPIVLNISKGFEILMGFREPEMEEQRLLLGFFDYLKTIIIAPIKIIITVLGKIWEWLQNNPVFQMIVSFLRLVFKIFFEPFSKLADGIKEFLKKFGIDIDKEGEKAVGEFTWFEIEKAVSKVDLATMLEKKVVPSLIPSDLANRVGGSLQNKIEEDIKKEDWGKRINEALFGEKGIPSLIPSDLASRVGTVLGKKVEEDIKKEDFGGKIGRTWDTTVKNVQNVNEKATTDLGNTWNTTIQNIGKGTEQFKTDIGKRWDDIVKFFDGSGHTLKTEVGKAWDGITKFFDEKGRWLRTEVGNAWTSIANFFDEKSKWLSDSLGSSLNSISDTFNSISNTLNKTLSGISNTISGIVGRVGGATKGGGGGGGSGGVSIPGFSFGPNFDYERDILGGSRAGAGSFFQTGGYIEKTGLYFLHGGEYVVPSWKVKDSGGANVNIGVNVNVNVQNEIGKIVNEIVEKIRMELYRELRMRGIGV